MRYPASEKLEIIRLVEGSHLPAKQTLDKLGIPKTTFYRWYDRYLVAGADGLEDHGHQSALADRLHLFEGYRLGLVLPVNNIG